MTLNFSSKYFQFWLPKIVSNWFHHKLQDLYCISSWVTSLEMNMIQVTCDIEFHTFPNVIGRYGKEQAQSKLLNSHRTSQQWTAKIL